MSAHFAQSPNRRTIAWDEFAERPSTNPSYESLRERSRSPETFSSRPFADDSTVDITNVTDVRLQTGCAIGSRSPNLVSRLSFSLMSGGELSLMDVDAIHAAQLAEWTDGIRVIRGEGGMTTQDSAGCVHVSDAPPQVEIGLTN